MSRRTYVDTGVLIAAYQGDHESHARAMAVLDDPVRVLIGSQYLILEVLPKPTFHGRSNEVAFMREALDAFAEIVQSNPEIASGAVDIASAHDVAGVDALHAAAALAANVDELVTTERESKPIFRVPNLTCVSILTDDEEQE